MFINEFVTRIKITMVETNQIANILPIVEKAREFQKKLTSALLTMQKSLTVRITTNSGKFLKTWEYQTTLPVS